MIVEKAEDIFEQISKDDFAKLVKVAQKYEDVPAELMLYQYETGNEILKKLQEIWVASLETSLPDYSVYSHPAYVNESFVCWKQYARRYIKLLAKYITRSDSVIREEDVHDILDLGCGCAYSTVGLKAVFPNAVVTGTNLAGTLQFSIDKDVTENIGDCDVVDESLTTKLPNVDMVFASEFFEHLTDPIDLLKALIDTYAPKYFVFANTFTKMSIGHFTSYSYDGALYTGAEMSRLFGTYLRKHGYSRVQTGFYNGRPQIYVRRPPKFRLRPLFEG